MMAGIKWKNGSDTHKKIVSIPIHRLPKTFKHRQITHNLRLFCMAGGKHEMNKKGIQIGCFPFFPSFKSCFLFYCWMEK